MTVGCNGFGQKIQLDPAHTSPIPISFWTGSKISQAPDTILQDIRSAGGWLYLSIGKHELAGQGREALVDGPRRLAEYDIKAYLSVRASNYLSVPVYDEWIANVREAVAMIQGEGITNVRGILGDAEHPKRMLPDLFGSDRDAFSRAVRDLAVLWGR